MEIESAVGCTGDEFARYGGFACSTPVTLATDTDHFTVEIRQYVGVTEDGTEGAVERDPVTVRLELSTDALFEMTPELAREVGLDLGVALATTAHRADVANRWAPSRSQSSHASRGARRARRRTPKSTPTTGAA